MFPPTTYPFFNNNDNNNNFFLKKKGSMHRHDTSIMNCSAMAAFQLKEQTFCIILNWTFKHFHVLCFWNWDYLYWTTFISSKCLDYLKVSWCQPRSGQPWVSCPKWPAKWAVHSGRGGSTIVMWAISWEAERLSTWWTSSWGAKRLSTGSSYSCVELCTVGNDSGPAVSWEVDSLQSAGKWRQAQTADCRQPEAGRWGGSFC